MIKDLQVEVPTTSCSIVEVATELFAAHGFDAVSISSIAEGAGMCKANIFRYFRSKDDLYTAVVERASEMQARATDAVCRVPGSAGQRLRTFMELEICGDRRRKLQALVLSRAAAHVGPCCAGELARAAFHRKFELLVYLLEQGRAQGEYKPTSNPTAVAMLLSGTIQWFLEHRDTMCTGQGCLGNEHQSCDTSRVYLHQILTQLLTGLVEA